MAKINALEFQRIFTKHGNGTFPPEETPGIYEFGDLDASGLGHLGTLHPNIKATHRLLEAFEEQGTGFVMVSHDGEAPDFVAASTLVGGSLPDNSVTLAKMADNSVGTNELIDDSVTAAKIAAGAVGSSEIATGAVGTDELADDAVTGDKVADTAIGTNHLANLAVTNGKIADATIQAGKLAESYIPVEAGTPTPETGNAAITGKFTAGQLAVLLTVAAAVGLEIKAAASQTGDLLQIKNSAGTTLWKVLADGSVDFMDIILNNVNIQNVTINNHKHGEGASFPGSPSAGDRFKLVKAASGSVPEFKMDFEYNGTEWLSVQYFTLPATNYDSVDKKIELPRPSTIGQGLKGFHIDAIEYGYTATGDGCDASNYYLFVAQAVALDFSTTPPTELTPTALSVVNGTNSTADVTVDGASSKKTLIYNQTVLSTATTQEYHLLRIYRQTHNFPPGSLDWNATVTGRWVGSN